MKIKLLNQMESIICEHSSEVELPDNVGNFMNIKHEKYGIITISIYTYWRMNRRKIWKVLQFVQEALIRLQMDI